MQFIRLSFAVLLPVVIAAAALSSQSESLEQSVCGSWREPFAFWIWSRAAGKPNSEAAHQIANAEVISHTTADGRILRGFKLRSTPTANKANGFVLVAQGNAMLADQLLASLTIFSQAGIDAYVFDYRGYGGSEGSPRLKAIVSDYREIFDRLATSRQDKRLLYGISFGGIVLLNVIGSGIAFDRAAIDSTPSRVSNFGCPKEYDPIANLPADASRFLFVAGEQDNVVPVKDSQKIMELAMSRGAQVVIRAEYAHPFMDSDSRVHRARLELIRAFLSDAQSGKVP
jgi:alpha-beta hydrolase superfamily lysophospholipase